MIVDGAALVTEAVGGAIALCTALLLWFVSVRHQRREDETRLMAALCAELTVVRGRMQRHLAALVGALARGETAQVPKIGFATPIYDASIPQLGLIRSRTDLSNVIRTFEMVRGFGSSEAVADVPPVVVAARRLDLALDALRLMIDDIVRTYRLPTSGSDLVDAVDMTLGHADTSLRLINVLFEQYPDYALAIYGDGQPRQEG